MTRMSYPPALNPGSGYARAPGRAAASSHTAMLKVLLLGALLSLAAVAGWQLAGGSPKESMPPALMQRMLKFSDLPDGAIRVVDAQTGVEVQVLRGELGFVRGVLRTMARDRRAHQVGSTPAFSLALHADSRVILSDPHTGQQLDLAAFGPDNVAVFLRWLPPSSVDGVFKP